MKFKPLNDRFAVGGMEQDGRAADGILIPDTAKDPRANQTPQRSFTRP